MCAICAKIVRWIYLQTRYVTKKRFETFRFVSDERNGTDFVSNKGTR